MATSDLCFHDCENSDNTAMNPHACKCGTADCKSNSTCQSADIKCTEVKACESLDGKEKSKVDLCLCGNVACKKDQTCKSTDNKCESGLLAGLFTLIALIYWLYIYIIQYNYIIK